MPSAEIQKSFCPWPFVGWSAQANGQLRICPASQASSSRGLCKSGDGLPLRVDEISVEASRNSPLHRELRLQMREGRVSNEVCGRCLREEAAGLTSRRQIELSRPWIDIERILSSVSETGEVNPQKLPLRLFDIRLGNHCNLTCRMCNPTSSSKWYREWFETRHRGFNDGDIRYQLKKATDQTIINLSQDYEWHNKSDLWDFLAQNGSHLQELHFSGGEPLLIEAHYALLERLVENGITNLMISYNTNLTALPEKALQLWSHFKTVHVAVSVDALGAANDYIRHPSSFSTIEKNLRRLDATGPNVAYWISTTMQILNAFECFDLFKWVWTADFKKMNHWNNEPGFGSKFIAHTLLTRPEHFSLQVLSPAAKQKWRIQAHEFLAWAQDFIQTQVFPLPDRKDRVWRQISEVIHGYENILFTQDKSHLIPALMKDLRLSDDYRKQNFAQTFPELSKDLL